MSQKYNLTRRQSEYLDWITAYIKNHEVGPTYKEIGQAMDTSTQAARKIVDEIINRGHLVKIDRKSRSLSVKVV